MKLFQPARFFSVSFAAFLFLFVSLDPGFFLNQPNSQRQAITTLTGGQNNGGDSNSETILLPGNISSRLGSLVSEVQYLALVVNRTVTTRPSYYYEGASAELMEFVAQVYNGEANTVRGIYIQNVLALPIIQQPQGNIAFVSDDDETITEFQSASMNGVTGLLAHNYLSGALFYNIQQGDEIFIVYGNGTLRRYHVNQISQYQRLERSNLRSNFVDLSSSENLTSDQVFTRYYRGVHRVTLQTCLARNGFSNWGLQFTQARSLDPFPLIPLP
jgi:hypothetical protein